MSILYPKEPEYDEKIALMSADAQFDIAEGEACLASEISSIKGI